MILHIEKASKQECLKLRSIAEGRGITLAEVVLEFLEQYKAEIKARREFIFDYPVLEKPFEEVVEAH